MSIPQDYDVPIPFHEDAAPGEAPPSPSHTATVEDSPHLNRADKTAGHATNPGNHTTAPTASNEAPVTSYVTRPHITFHSAADAAEWLKTELGRGQLSGIFQRNGTLVHTPREGEDGYIPPAAEDATHAGPAQVQPLTLHGLLARVQYTYRISRALKEGGFKQAVIPQDAVKIAYNSAGTEMLPNVRTLRGVTHVPVVRADGSLLDTPGYDSATQLLYLPDRNLHVPTVSTHPSSAETQQAVAWLDYMTAEFPFVTDSDRANYYGMLLTPLLRELTPPPYRLCAIGARHPGSGKSLLSNVLRTLHGGVFRCQMPEEEELRKEVSTILETNTGAVVEFDNVEGFLRSPTLAGLLTSSTWATRKLGGMDAEVARPNDRLWVLTGNNLTIGGDLPRRTLWCTIDPQVPSPEARTGFQIPDLPAWVHEHRGSLIWALMTLVRSWIAVGSPQRTPTSDSYGQWVAAVDGILTNAGVPGRFADPATSGGSETDEEREWSQFMDAVGDVFGTREWTAKELLGQVETPGNFGSVGTIPYEALPDELAKRIRRDYAGDPTAATKPLGMWLRNRNGRWYSTRTIRHVGTRKRAALWQVQDS